MTNTFPPTPVISTTARRAPGRGLAIGGFVLSLLGALSPIGLVLSVIAFVQARREGARGGIAVAGIVIGGIGTVVLAVVAVYSVVMIGDSTGLCSIKELLDGACR